MLIGEARTLGSALAGLPSPAFPIANVGSQSVDFRTRTQPWIEEYVFKPLLTSGRRVVNVDLAASEGVDVVADVSTEDGRSQVATAGARSVMCSNLLEHVVDPAGTLAALTELVAADAYLVLSGPLNYPYHPDPIDNGFRPTSAEVVRMLPDTFRVVASQDVRCQRMLRYDLGRVRKLLFERGRAHSAAPDDVPASRVTVRLLVTRLLWTFRRPSCYVVVARRI